VSRGLIIDVETTGLNPRRDEIVELAAIPFDYSPALDRVTEHPGAYVGFREPSIRIDPRATNIHGITNAMVAGAVLHDDSVLALLNSADFVVAHHARFDYGFVVPVYPLAARRPWLCSLRQIDWARHGYYLRALGALAAAHHIPVPSAHRAEGDCRTLLRLLAARSGDGRSYCAELWEHLPGGPTRSNITRTTHRSPFSV